MVYSVDYFRFQLVFAQHVCDSTGISPIQGLEQFTSFYKNFVRQGLRVTPTMDNLASTEHVDALYDFYLSNAEPDELVFRPFGCFWYEYNAETQLARIHFRNNDAGEPGALSAARRPARLAELSRMFRAIRTEHPEAASVEGFSWLYNIRPYAVLFPSAYLDTATVVRNWFESAALWGQFLDSSGHTKKDMVSAFLARLEAVDSSGDWDQCFDYKVLAPRGPIAPFFEFYTVCG